MAEPGSRGARIGLVLAIVLGAAAPAAADIPGPYDRYCSVELQERDGSSCEQCSSSIQQRMEGAPDPCAALVARGLTLRCGYGATVSVAVYCDRPGDFVAIAGGTRTEDPTAPAPPIAGAPSCGCRAGGGGRSAIPIALVAIALALARARRR